MQALFYVIGTCESYNPPKSLAYIYRIGNYPITFDLAKDYIKKHDLCQVTYQEVDFEPSQTMMSQFGLVWKDLDSPGRYIIQTAS